MTDTLFADISYYQPKANDSYPYQFIAFRANDGTFRDPNFAANLAWAKSAVARGRLTGFLVYLVYETNWQDTVNTFKSMVGTPHPKMAVLIDAESWGGKIRGNQSAGLNAMRENLISWLGGNRKRVIGYGNVGDLNGMWAQRGDTKVILANYSSNPAFPGKIAHQFTDAYACAPFGHCDMNSADGLSPAQFAAALGLVVTPPTPPAPRPPAPKGPSRIYSPGGLAPGQALVSPSGHYVSVLQSDGNFVKYNWVSGHADWNAGTPGKKVSVLSIQGDGNIVLYAGKNPVWNSHTAGHGAIFLQQQDDGSLAAYTVAGNKLVWHA